MPQLFSDSSAQLGLLVQLLYTAIQLQPYHTVTVLWLSANLAAQQVDLIHACRHTKHLSLYPKTEPGDIMMVSARIASRVCTFSLSPALASTAALLPGAQRPCQVLTLSVTIVNACPVPSRISPHLCPQLHLHRGLQRLKAASRPAFPSSWALLPGLRPFPTVREQLASSPSRVHGQIWLDRSRAVRAPCHSGPCV